ncbi:sugar phosphate nucleotidyltransferase [Megasphaera sp. BL7]|uniref:sugar phosphate nucleotidyltransferase n=1 Tax=Megasphaera sp. BL7 TaxID=1285585 RepID=UPI000410C5BD
MKKSNCLAMILAGGKGSRLGVLTKDQAKPGLLFGGKYRIIDFPLSNCRNSGIDTVGILTQYQPLELNWYIGNGSSWNLDSTKGGTYVLPPYQSDGGSNWYRGTADAIYQNLNFVEMVGDDYVLILSGDHIYSMDYDKMLNFHKKHHAKVTIGTIRVPWDEASRFGIMVANENMRITKFQEKPAKPESNLASMGIYIFDRDVLESYLKADAKDEKLEHDFGKNVIPAMLADQVPLYAYPFEGYWRMSAPSTACGRPTWTLSPTNRLSTCATASGASIRATRVYRRTSSGLTARLRVPSSLKARKSSGLSAIQSSSTVSPSKKGRKSPIPSSCPALSSKKMPSSTRPSWANAATSIPAPSSTMKTGLSPYWDAKGN